MIEQLTLVLEEDNYRNGTYPKPEILIADLILRRI